MVRPIESGSFGESFALSYFKFYVAVKCTIQADAEFAGGKSKQEPCSCELNYRKILTDILNSNKVKNKEILNYMNTYLAEEEIYMMAVMYEDVYNDFMKDHVLEYVKSYILTNNIDCIELDIPNFKDPIYVRLKDDYVKSYYVKEGVWDEGRVERKVDIYGNVKEYYHSL